MLSTLGNTSLMPSPSRGGETKTARLAMKGRNIGERPKAFQKRVTTRAKHLAFSALRTGQRPEHGLGSAGGIAHSSVHHSIKDDESSVKKLGDLLLAYHLSTQ